MTPFHFTSTVGSEGIIVPAQIESKADLLAFLAQAVPLPDYFGRNWDALDECLGDLEWLEIPQIVLIHEDIPLQNAPADQRLYLKILADAAKKSERLKIVFPENCRAHVARIVSVA
jgi:RNAse (barnase) inhibitor barstar